MHVRIRASATHMRLLDSLPCIAFAVRFAVHLKVAIRERSSTIKTPEATDMVLDRQFIFQVLAFNSALTAPAQTAIQFVIVLFAMWPVVENVELGRGEWLRASGTYEARLVVLPRQPTISG